MFIMFEIGIVAAFIGGLLSFLSPCVFPLIPGFLAYLAGSGKHATRYHIFLNSVAYVLGFSIIFSLLGVLLSTVLSTIAFSLVVWMSRIGGIIIILFGIHVIGILKLPLLDREYHIKMKKFSVSYFTSFLFGAAFAVGWTPCVGAVLGAVLVLAATSPGLSFLLLMSYSLGLGLPFLFVGLFSDKAITLINKSERFLKYFNIIVGILLIILGILVFTSKLNIVANLSILNDFLLR